MSVCERERERQRGERERFVGQVVEMALIRVAGGKPRRRVCASVKGAAILGKKKEVCSHLK